MKKIFAALTAFICAASVFTGCGKIDDKDDKKDSGKQSGKSTEDELEEVVQELIDAGKNMDIEKIAKLSLPDELADTLFSMAADEINELKKEAEDELTDNIDGKLVSVKKTEDIDKSYLSLLEKGSSAVMIVADYMKENNIDIEDLKTMDDSYLYDLITDESLEGTPMGDLISILDSIENYDSVEDFAASKELDKIESRYSITDGCMAEVTIEVDGETKTIEVPFYKIKDEGWNGEMILYPTMIGYVAKSKQSSLNSSASSLNKAADVALTEMDEQGLDIDGTFIIGSDEKLNHNVSSDFDMETFSSAMNEYYNDTSDVNYFLVINKGICEYAVCEKPDDDSYGANVGTYPIKSVPESFDDSFFETKPATTDEEKLTFQELYDMAAELIDNPSASDDE